MGGVTGPAEVVNSGRGLDIFPEQPDKDAGSPVIAPGRVQGRLVGTVRTGKSRQLEALRADLSPEFAAINDDPRLDAARVLGTYPADARVNATPFCAFHLQKRLTSGFTVRPIQNAGGALLTLSAP